MIDFRLRAATLLPPSRPYVSLGHLARFLLRGVMSMSRAWELYLPPSYLSSFHRYLPLFSLSFYYPLLLLLALYPSRYLYFSHPLPLPPPTFDLLSLLSPSPSPLSLSLSPSPSLSLFSLSLSPSPFSPPPPLPSHLSSIPLPVTFYLYLSPLLFYRISLHPSTFYLLNPFLPPLFDSHSLTLPSLCS